MMHHAWKGYESKAWGANEIKPVSGQRDKGIIVFLRLSVCLFPSFRHPERPQDISLAAFFQESNF